jgi:predicted GIY-YIG superfamily endonuclease
MPYVFKNHAKIKGYTVFIVECADESYYSGMCLNLEKEIKSINRRLIPHFKGHPKKVPVKVVFHEDHIPFKEAFVKHIYLRSLTRRHRIKLIQTGEWPRGRMLREFAGCE